MDPVHPTVLTKHVQSASDGFIETARSNFDRVFGAFRIATGHFASSKIHVVILSFRFFFAKSRLFGFSLDRDGADGVEVVAVTIYLAL